MTFSILKWMRGLVGGPVRADATAERDVVASADAQPGAQSQEGGSSGWAVDPPDGFADKLAWQPSGDTYDQMLEFALQPLRGPGSPSSVALVSSTEPAAPGFDVDRISMPVPPDAWAKLAQKLRRRASMPDDAREGILVLHDDPAEREQREAARREDVKRLDLQEFFSESLADMSELAGPISIQLTIDDSSQPPTILLARRHTAL